VQDRRDRRYFALNPPVPRHDVFGTWNIVKPRFCTKPIPDGLNRATWPIQVLTDVLSRDIGNKLVIAIPVTVKNESRLFTLTTGAEFHAPKSNSELEGHIEPRQ
jgi:hypothetical protein